MKKRTTNLMFFIENNIKSIIATFLIIQPILDLNYFFVGRYPTIFGVGIPTFIRMGFSGIMVLYLIWRMFHNKVNIRTQYFKIIIYILMYLIIYAIIHTIMGLKYNGSDFEFSLISEVRYFVRMLLPVLLIFVFLQISPKSILEVVYKSWLILVPVTIVVLNVLTVSLSSYTNKTISANFFSWFGKGYVEYSYLQLSSKGFFRYANQIGLILASLTPIASIKFFKRKNFSSLISICLFMLSMVMIGTKVALFSFPLLFLASFSIYWFFDIKDKFSKNNINLYFYVVFVFIIFVLLYPFSPSVNRSSITNSIVYKSKFDIRQKTASVSNIPIDFLFYEEEFNAEGQILTDDEMIDYIEDTYPTKRINDKFLLDIYHYKKDPQFWYEVLQLSDKVLINQRNVEQMILQRVKELNNNPFESLFGMGYSRMQNIFPLERDFVSHFYTVGILGIPIILPQFVFLSIFMILVIIKRIYFKFNTYSSMLLLILIYSMFIAYNSGNILDSLFPSILLSFFFALIIEEYKKTNTRVKIKGESI